MVQKLTQRFYREITSRKGITYGEKIYLFKTYLDGHFGWLSAYKDKQRKHFVVESGAGISLGKMEKQLDRYFGLLFTPIRVHSYKRRV